MDGPGCIVSSTKLFMDGGTLGILLGYCPQFAFCRFCGKCSLTGGGELGRLPLGVGLRDRNRLLYSGDGLRNRF